jgi:hypothetical protein
MTKRKKRRPLSSDEHAVASERHARAAGALRPMSRDWATVAYFYAAYHLVKQAMLEDPIWLCPDELAIKHPELGPHTSKVTRHHGQPAGRRGNRAWGVTDLVEVLYPSIHYSYVRMHEASIQVRYQRGLQTPLRVSASHWAKIRAEFRAGRMRAT